MYLNSILPKSIKIHEGSDTVNEVNPKLEFNAGEAMKEKTNYWVTVYNGEKPPKAITERHQKKIGVKVEVCDITLNTLVQKASGVRNVSKNRYPPITGPFSELLTLLISDSLHISLPLMLLPLIPLLPPFINPSLGV